MERNTHAFTYAIEAIRGISPLIALSDDTKMCQNIIQKWLLVGDKDPIQDIVVDRRYTGGFEWPWVLLVTNKEEFHQFIERNCIMRAMTRLVVLRIESTNHQYLFDKW